VNNYILPKTTSRIIGCLFLSLLTNTVLAQNEYWSDSLGSATPSGNWEDSTAWSTSSSGSSPGGWTEGGTPIFAAGSAATGSYTVTANSSHTIAGLQFQASSGTASLTINGPGVLSLAPGQQVFSFSNTYVINAVLGGTGGLINTNGTLYLYGNNTYSGGTTLAANNLIYYNNSNSFGTGPITNTDTQSLLTTNVGSSIVTIPNAFWINNPGTLNFGDGNTICSGPWNLQQNLVLKNNAHAGSNLFISGPISGAAGAGLNLLAGNSGAITLSGQNTYSGVTSIAYLNNSSTTVALSVTSINSVSTPTPQAYSSLGCPNSVANGTINIGDIGTDSQLSPVLIYTGAGETSDRVINLCGTTGGATIEMDGAGPLVLTGGVTSVAFGSATGAGSKTLTLQGSSTALNTISGAIVDPSGYKTSVTKTQAGTWVLSGANTYSGNTTVSAGTLKQGAANVIPNGTGKGNFASTGGAAAGTFNLNGYNCSINGFGTSTGIIDNTTGTATLTIGYSGATSTTTHGGIIQDTSPGVLNITIDNCSSGGGAVFTGTNTYQGLTTINSGLLSISNDFNLGAAPIGSPVANQLTLNNNPALNYGLRAQSANTTLSANRGITLGANGGSIQVQTGFSLTVPGIITGSGGLMCGTSPSVGTGTLILSGANNYSGGTTIACGTLKMSAGGSLPSTTALTVASASSGDGGVFNMNSVSQTIASLASSTGINGTGTTTPSVQLGSGTLTLGVASVNTAFAGVISGTGSLTLASTFTSSTLALSGANTYTGGTTINAGTLNVTGSIVGNVTVNGGTLELGNTTSLAPTATVTLAGSAAVDLNFSGTQTIGALFINGFQVAPGIYGAPAYNPGGIFSGTGTINVTSGPPPVTISSTTINVNNQLVIGWNSATGENYNVYTTTNLAPPVTWTLVNSSPIPATGASTSYTLPGNVSNHPALFITVGQ
jgi:fibronectin-binding autotransporter adhesin